MIEILRAYIKDAASSEDKVNKLREVLQLVVLKILYEKSLFAHIAFVGGTALRILFDLRRFSEDLDFSLIDKKGYQFSTVRAQLERELKLYGLRVEFKVKEERTIQSIMLRFGGVLKELGLSSLKDQKVSIKLKIDTNPPVGAYTVSSLVNKVYMMNITHFDLSSMFATKLHACFFRKFTKGRDFYDFIWYMGKRVKPNFVLLNNAIIQTQKRASNVHESNFKEFLLEHIQKIDFEHVKNDVERFLEDKRELNLFDARVIKESIETVYGIGS